MRSLSIVLFLFSANCSISTFQAHAIEAARVEALQENKEILTSVLKIGIKIKNEDGGVSDGICSSTLISENILLTAQHCVTSMKDGDDIAINDQNNYRVVKVAQPQKIVVPYAPVKNLLTDVALILIAPKNKAINALQTIKPAKIAVSGMIPQLSKTTLIAGYGLSSLKISNAGTLRAGYNELVKGYKNEIQVDTLTQIVGSPALASELSTEEEFVTLGIRTNQFTYDFKKGDNINEAVLNVSQKFKTDGRATVHPGDSGGPIFAYYNEDKTKPVLIGVTSQFAPSIANSPFVMHTKIMGFTFDAKTAPEDFFSQGPAAIIYASVQDMNEQLKSSVLSVDGKIAFDFTMVGAIQSVRASLFVSALAESNAKFIQESLTSLTEIRDCQLLKLDRLTMR